MSAGGNCGCGYLGTCYEDCDCGCEWDHGDVRRCEVHELEYQAEVMASRVDASSDWALDSEMLGEA